MVADDHACGDEEEDDHACCDNAYTSVSTDDSFAKSSVDFDLNVQFVTTFIATYIQPFTLESTYKRETVTNYHPPPLITDIPVIYETFLI